MAYADAIKYNKIRSMKGLPIGAIVPWSADQGSIPNGWIISNGATVATTRYPLLYEIVGNVYGGISGSTFRIPPLTNTQQGIMDAYRGHYQYLKDRNEDAHKPVTTTLANDRFWTIVSTGNGDQGSTQTVEWPSSIDLVGSITGSPRMVGGYSDITLSQGDFSWVASWNETTLGDVNLPQHSHSYSGSETDSYSRSGGGTAAWCNGTRREAECDVRCTTTTAWRVAANPNSATRVSTGDNQTDLRSHFLYSDLGRAGTGGGGNIRGLPSFGSGGRGESGATQYIDGNGRCGGRMSCGSDILFTSLSNTEGSGQAGSSDPAPHGHGTTTYNARGTFQVLSPGQRTDVGLGSVAINNTPGQNFGNITATTATPTLDMLYIIRAY